MLLFVQELMLHILVHEIQYGFECFNFDKQVNVTLRWDSHYLFMLQIFHLFSFLPHLDKPKMGNGDGRKGKGRGLTEGTFENSSWVRESRKEKQWNVIFLGLGEGSPNKSCVYLINP